MAIEAAKAFRNTYQGAEPNSFNVEVAIGHMFTVMETGALSIRSHQRGESNLAEAQINEASSYLFPESLTLDAEGLLPRILPTPKALSERQRIITDGFAHGDFNPFLQRFEETSQMLSTLSGEDFTFLKLDILKSTPQEVPETRLREHHRLTRKFYEPQAGETWDETDEIAWSETPVQAERVRGYLNFTASSQTKFRDLDSFLLDMIGSVKDADEAAKPHLNEDGNPVVTKALADAEDVLNLVMAGHVEEWLE